jgi:hypothetical protein
MPPSAASPIPLVLIFTTVGFIVGAIVAYVAARSQPGKQPKSPDFTLFNERKKRFDEIVGLWRERAGGKVVVWFEDKMLESPKSLDPIRRRRLESAEHDFQTWLATDEPVAPVEAGKNAAIDSRLTSVTRTPTGPLSTPARKQTGPLMTAARTPTGPLTAPARPSTGPLQIRKPAPQKEDIPQPATVAEETPRPAKVAKPLSIVDQINDILQETIKDTPLANRMIRIVEDPREGVVVWIGLEHFPGVDSVPDPEVKAALRKAANEWERRTELHR